MVDALLTHGVSPESIWAQGRLTSPAGSLAPAALLNPLTGRSLKPPVEGPRSSKTLELPGHASNPDLARAFCPRPYRPFFESHKLFEKLRKSMRPIKKRSKLVGVRDAGPDELGVLRQATTTRCTGAMAIDGCFALELPHFLSAYWQWAMKQGLQMDTEAPKMPLRFDVMVVQYAKSYRRAFA